MDKDEWLSRYFRANLFNGVDLAFLHCDPDRNRHAQPQGTVLLIHGFPETSYVWRAVIPILTEHGYRVLAPDYRGAGESSKPTDGFTKASMALDMVMLLDERDIHEPVHVVGHNIGASIAFTLASRWPERVASLCLAECLLPGTSTFEEEVHEYPDKYFYYTFHCIENLPEALIGGKERTYIQYFIDKRCYRLGACSSDVLTQYTHAYSQPGALRCAFDLYRAFQKDAEDLILWMKEHGKCDVPTLVLYGQYSSDRSFATKMALEVVEEQSVQSMVVEDAGHFLPEENPHALAEKLLAFIGEERKRIPKNAPGT